LGICLALVLFLFSAMAGQTASQPRLRYQVFEIPVKPWHLSDSGEVTGKTKKNQAAIWSRRRGLRLLPMLKGLSEGEARGSNASGYVVGFATSSGQVAAFGYKNGQLIRFPGKNSKALAVNDAGDVVGESEIEGKAPVVAALWNNRQVTRLGGCCGGVARGINNHGQIVGDLYDQAGRYRAFLWDGVRGIEFLGPAGGYSSAIAINDAGHVLLQELERGMSVYRSPETTIHIEIPGREPGDGRAINNADEVVGAFGPYFDADHAFLWSEKDGFRDLNDLIPANSGWKLQVATGINDRGEIVGFGTHSGEDVPGFLLIPERK
jgi:probable HAF family extracellular repeat protein